jgi:peptidoglycan/LPS O-acetylase OafA/YrhL
MSHNQVVLPVILFLLPVGILLFLAVPRIRTAVHISQQRQVLLSLVFLTIMVGAVTAQTFTEGRFLFYETVGTACMAGVVAVRVGKYFKARRKP